MEDWNVVVTTVERGFKHARSLLMPFGTVHKTDFYNVLVLKVPDPAAFAEQLREASEQDPSALECIARAVPATATFTFQSPEEFEQKARRAVEPWIPALAGKGFHVRMHRRGFKGRISSQDEERFLDHFIIEGTEARGEAAHVTFDDPDLILALETVGQQAGLSLWSRADRERYPFLKLD
ncbi:MAG: hypothetical protein GWO16_14220 [Gammaproteobacteria bacterium]|nr:hypothetical protein [Gammaproteobacteria bacterium]NIR99085.1 hypothetical protein [Gammaproteobacteria bacterium]NIT64717.1 hypothetical protein [Gammaproteobacteria bacterium]NIV21675.1 hypothetical protein [Gammaproteobacteria bacterium]NIX10637.1 hypothetical protein [Gammaproteobacteria bacterium]